MGATLDTRLCARCKEPATRGALCATHNEDMRRYRQEYRERHPDRVKKALRAARLKQAFKLTMEQLDEMFARQDGLCAICKRQMTIHTTRHDPLRAYVDHDHETGAVRSLLCMPCNVGLGNFGDDTERLQQAVDYLKGHRS